MDPSCVMSLSAVHAPSADQGSKGMSQCVCAVTLWMQCWVYLVQVTKHGWVQHVLNLGSGQ